MKLVIDKMASILDEQLKRLLKQPEILNMLTNIIKEKMVEGDTSSDDLNKEKIEDDTSFTTAEDDTKLRKDGVEENEVVNIFLLKKIEGDGKCGLSALSYILNTLCGKRNRENNKINDSEILNRLLEQYKKMKDKIDGIEIANIRSKGNSSYTVGEYGRFLQSIENSSRVAEEDYLSDTEIGLVAKGFNINIVILHEKKINDVPKHLLHGDDNDPVFFLRHRGMHYDVLALMEGVIYDEKQFNGSKGGIEIVGDLTNGNISRHFTKRDFMAWNENAESAQSVFDFDQVYEQKKDEGYRRNWADYDSSDEDVKVVPRSRAKKNKKQRDSIGDLAKGVVGIGPGIDYTGINFGSSPFSDHRGNQRRLSGNDFKQEQGVDLLKSVLKVGQKLHEHKPSEAKDEDPSSSDSSSSASSASSRSSKSKKKAKKSKKKSKSKRRENGLFKRFIKSFMDTKHEDSIKYEHLSVEEMIARGIYLTAKNFFEARDSDKLGIMSQHIDLVADFKLDKNNSMYKFGLSSTTEKEVKVYTLNQHTVKGEVLDTVVDEVGSRAVVESTASFSSLSDSTVEKVVIVAVVDESPNLYIELFLSNLKSATKSVR